MTNWWQSIVLGIVEGITEFLPISSTGHLTVTEKHMGLPIDDPSGDDRDFSAGKLQACRFFFATELPLVEHHARLVRDGEASAFEMRAGWF